MTTAAVGFNGARRCHSTCFSSFFFSFFFSRRKLLLALQLLLLLFLTQPCHRGAT